MRRRRMMLPLAMLLVALVVVVGAAWVQWGQPSPIVRVMLVGQDPSAFAVDARSGHVYVSVWGPPRDEIRVLDAVSGVVQRTLPTSPGPLQFAVAADVGHIFTVQGAATGQDMRVAMLDARHDTLLHTTVVPLAPSSFPQSIVARGRTVAIASAGNEVCIGPAGTCRMIHSGVALLDAVSGRLLHVFHVPGQPVAVAVDERPHHILVASSMIPVVSSASQSYPVIFSVFDATTERLLRHANLSTLTVPWHMAVDEQTGRAFVLAESVFQPNQQLQSSLYVLDTHTVRLLRTLTVRGVFGDIVVDEHAGRVFVTNSGPQRYIHKTGPGGGGLSTAQPIGPGSLDMLDARTGALVRTIPLGIAPSAIAIDEQRDRVFVANRGSHDQSATVNGTPIDIPAPVTGPGGLTILDARTGHVLHTLYLGTQPTAIAIDAPTQRAFIGDIGDSEPRPAPDPWAWIPSSIRQHLPFLPRHPSARRPIPGSVIVLDTSRL